MNGSRPIEIVPEFFERRALAHQERRDPLHVRIGVRHQDASRVDISVSGVKVRVGTAHSVIVLLATGFNNKPVWTEPPAFAWAAGSFIKEVRNVADKGRIFLASKAIDR